MRARRIALAVLLGLLMGVGERFFTQPAARDAAERAEQPAVTALLLRAKSSSP